MGVVHLIHIIATLTDEFCYMELFAVLPISKSRMSKQRQVPKVPDRLAPGYPDRVRA